MLGPYEIKSVLGVGGMGEIYRARDCRLNRDVAIKVLREDGASADLRSRFECEARAVAALNHSDPQTRSELQSAKLYTNKNSRRDDPIKDANGSVDLYVGPTAPAGKEKNWTQSVPGKASYTCLRLYGPLEPWFDKTWRPGEVELVK
jgi:serine/threonine protein kinase